MKIRIWFVTNSSSSNFLFDKTVFDSLEVSADKRFEIEDVETWQKYVSAEVDDHEDVNWRNQEEVAEENCLSKISNH